MRTTLLVATALAAALPNIASAQNTRQVSIPFHVIGIMSLQETDVFLDGDKVLLNPREPERSEPGKRGVVLIYADGTMTDATLGKLEVTGARYTTAVPGQDYRKREGTTIFKDASGDVLIAHTVGKGTAPSQTTRLAIDAASFMAGTGKFEGASGSYDAKATADLTTNKVTVDYTGTVNLVCGGKRQADACTK